MSDDELKAMFETLRQDNAEIRRDNAEIRRENAEMRRENAEMHVETRRHFDVVAEGMEKRFDLLAEASNS